MGIFAKKNKNAREILSELRHEIKGNSRIVMRNEIDEYIRKQTDNLIGHWLGEEWYIKQQEEQAARKGLSFFWAGANEEDKKRRLHIINRLGSDKELSSKFKNLVQELIIFLQRPDHDLGDLHNNPKNITKAKKIGEELCNLTKKAIGEEAIDLMQLYHLIIDAIDVDVARWLEFKWQGVCGWIP